MRRFLFSFAFLFAFTLTAAEATNAPKQAPQPATVLHNKAVSAATTEEAASAKKGERATQQTKNQSAKQVGLGNDVPLLLADAVRDTWTARQQASLYYDIFPFLKRLRQVDATPPLLAGIRQEHSDALAKKVESKIVFRSMLTRKLMRQEEERKSGETLDMLTSLVELQKNIRQQMDTISKKQMASASTSEKQILQEELTKLDKQLADTAADFERIATGVPPNTFTEKETARFDWKNELTVLLEPSIKELKQLTARARKKTEIKDTINDYSQQLDTAHSAVVHLNKLIKDAKSATIKTYLGDLLSAWQNVEKRLDNKLDLARRELVKLEDKDVSLLKSSSNAMQSFFRDRGGYLLIALLVFAGVFLAFRLMARLLLLIIPGAHKEQRPFHLRVLDIFFKICSVIFAVGGLIFVLYTAEDWLLLSVAIILLLGVIWAVRQTLPKMWKQVRMMLNMGSIREGERVMYNGVPWRVETLNVFCKLHNPALGMHLRIPIENMIGAVSRPYHPDEPWFPCKRGDWVAIDGKPFAKVVSLSHEQVEVIEMGGRRTVYQTSIFLSKSPANLSSNFNLRVVFGLSYALQAEITTTVLETLKAFVQKKMEEHGYAENCLSLSVDFLQAGPSSLDVAIMGDFKGEAAPVYRRIERALAKWAVDCCNAHGWEIPFPQMTVHLAQENDA
ncbi:MAG: mechanosensitive ion channel family protein [Desulfobulbus sp.]|nr:mechanosensitive ion channel family protein [Desulfobulbus sp.]